MTRTFEVKTNGKAIAAFATTWLPHGANTVTAQYVSDGNFLASTNSVTQLVDTPPVANLLVLAAVSVPAHGVTSTDGINATYTATNNFIGANLFNYTVSDAFGATATNSVTVSMIANGGSLNSLAAGFSAGNLALTFYGIPWSRCALEQTLGLSPAVWVPVVTNLSPANGLLQITNAVGVAAAGLLKL